MPETRFLVSVAALFAVGAGLIVAIHRVHAVEAARRRRDWLKYAVYVVLINALWASVFVGRGVAFVLLGFIVVAGAVEIRRVVRPSGPAGVIAFLLFSAALLPMLDARVVGWQRHFAFVVLVVATVDAFGELVGRLVGRRPLVPRVSPGKTVEGLVGGLTMAVTVAMALGFMTPWRTPVAVAVAGVVTALGAVAGDLVFSALKRRAGVKDFSGWIPGHGGVLDRFDSLLLGAPAFALVRILLTG